MQLQLSSQKTHRGYKMKYRMDTILFLQKHGMSIQKDIMYTVIFVYIRTPHKSVDQHPLVYLTSILWR